MKQLKTHFFRKTVCTSIYSRRTALFIILYLLFTNLYSQKENNIWITGHQDLNETIAQPDTGVQKLFGGNIFDFNNDPKSEIFCIFIHN